MIFLRPATAPIAAARRGWKLQLPQHLAPRQRFAAFQGGQLGAHQVLVDLAEFARRIVVEAAHVGVDLDPAELATCFQTVRAGDLRDWLVGYVGRLAPDVETYRDALEKIDWSDRALIRAMHETLQAVSASDDDVSPVEAKIVSFFGRYANAA